MVILLVNMYCTKKVVAPEIWLDILEEFGIKKEEDFYHLNVEEASKLIGELINMPDK